MMMMMMVIMVVMMMMVVVTIIEIASVTNLSEASNRVAPSLFTAEGSTLLCNISLLCGL